MSETTVRDSAGVRIVEHAGEPTGVWSLRLSAEPRFRHGHRAGDYQFRFVGAGALQPDGSVVVGDAGNQEVVVIARDGSRPSVLARSGQGPDEVRRVNSITVLGQDTVMIEDDGNTKLMLFVGGELSRTVSTAGDPALGGGLMVRGVDDAGRPLMVTGSYRSGFEQPWLPGHMVRLDLDTRQADTVARYDYVPRRAEPENPFAAFGFATVTGRGFVSGRGDVPELVWRAPNGDVRQIVRWDPPSVYPSEAMWEGFANRLRTQLPRANPQMSRQRVEEFVSEQLERYEVRYDEPLPLFGLVRGDDEGGVWLSDYASMSATLFPSHYTVVSPEGEWLGGVAMPPSFRILDVAHGLVLGVEQDELDVQSVAVYGVES